MSKHYSSSNKKRAPVISDAELEALWYNDDFNTTTNTIVSTAQSNGKTNNHINTATTGNTTIQPKQPSIMISSQPIAPSNGSSTTPLSSLPSASFSSPLHTSASMSPLHASAMTDDQLAKRAKREAMIKKAMSERAKQHITLSINNNGNTGGPSISDQVTPITATSNAISTIQSPMTSSPISQSIPDIDTDKLKTEYNNHGTNSHPLTDNSSSTKQNLSHEHQHNGHGSNQHAHYRYHHSHDSNHSSSRNLSNHHSRHDHHAHDPARSDKHNTHDNRAHSDKHNSHSYSYSLHKRSRSPAPHHSHSRHRSNNTERLHHDT